MGNYLQRVPLALGRCGQWPGGAAAGAMQPFIAPLSSNWCVPPPELRPAGLPAAPRSAIGWSWASAGRVGVLPSQFKIIDPSAPVSGERLSDDDSSQKEKKSAFEH